MGCLTSQYKKNDYAKHRLTVIDWINSIPWGRKRSSFWSHSSAS